MVKTWCIFCDMEVEVQSVAIKGKTRTGRQKQLYLCGICGGRVVKNMGRRLVDRADGVVQGLQRRK